MENLLRLPLTTFGVIHAIRRISWTFDLCHCAAGTAYGAKLCGGNVYRHLANALSRTNDWLPSNYGQHSALLGMPPLASSLGAPSFIRSPFLLLRRIGAPSIICTTYVNTTVR